MRLFKSLFVAMVALFIFGCNAELSPDSKPFVNPNSPDADPESQVQSYPSEAIGYYTDGRLKTPFDLLQIGASNVHKLLLDRNRSYATGELVTLVKALSDYTARLGQKLQVGDLSEFEGGKTAQHQSHQNGLDADVVYITRNGNLQNQRETYWTEYFVSNNRLSSNFDTAKNWQVIKWLSLQENVQRILVDSVIKNALCNEARRLGELQTQAKALALLRREDTVHKTHFHVRIACPKDDKSCVAQEPPPPGADCN